MLGDFLEPILQWLGIGLVPFLVIILMIIALIKA